MRCRTRRERTKRREAKGKRSERGATGGTKAKWRSRIKERASRHQRGGRMKTCPYPALWSTVSWTTRSCPVLLSRTPSTARQSPQFPINIFLAVRYAIRAQAPTRANQENNEHGTEIGARSTSAFKQAEILKSSSSHLNPRSTVLAGRSGENAPRAVNRYRESSRKVMREEHVSSFWVIRR